MPFTRLKSARMPVYLLHTIPVILVLSLTVPLSAREKIAGNNNADDKSRTMTFQIRDEQGQPLPGAKLFANVAFRNELNKYDIVNSHHVADSAGKITLLFPARTESMRLWVTKPDYVSEYVSFGEGDEEQEKHFPDQFDFELARGTKISGIVVDIQGQPIPDVNVDVSLTVRNPDKDGHPLPMININTEAVTDKAGKWAINIAPAKRPGKDVQFELTFTHKDYLSDIEPGQLQFQQNLTTAMLRDGTAKIVLRSGKSIKGTVLNTAGDPVTKGIVVWNDSPYFSRTVNETNIDESGHFETIALPPGKHPVTVVAPGYMPVRQIVKVNESLKDLSFALQPGKRLTLKIIDPDGKPVPKASVSLQGWRGAESLYNVRHSNVLNSEIPTRADENGVYVWDWAPADPVTYRILGKNCAKSVTLAATEKAHVIQLDSPLTASGKVKDATTGKPLSNFRVIPVIEFRPDFLSTSFSNAVQGKAGEYQITLDPTMDNYRRLIRIEADGYRSALSESSFGLGEGPVVQDFTLEPASARQGKVVDADGKPVANASIRIGTPSIVPIVSNGISDQEGMPENTSGEGEFQLAATFEPTRIRAIHDSGYAEVLRQPDEEIGTLTLQPWASVSGQLFQAGQPVAKQWVYFTPIQKRSLTEARLQDTFAVKTDQNGRFEFKRLPPMAGSVQAYVSLWSDSPLTSSESLPLDLQPGEHKTIELGNKGTTVTGTVVATGRGEVTLNKNWSLNYLIRRDDGISLPEDFPKLSFDPSGPMQTSWALDPHYASWVRSRPYYFIKLTPEGQLQIGGVPPGEYDLVLRLFEEPAGCLVEAVGTKVIPVTVTAADIKAKNKDLGSIEVACRVGPRVGESMYAYKFTDTTGVEHSIYDMKSRYVLMHVWASWCAPCLKNMPDIQATADQLADKPITLVGLNIDKHPEDAERLVEKHKWNWAQNYLGDQSDMARQLAISSVPVYYLIGPDGLLKATATEWTDMKATLKETFKEKQ